MIHILHLSLYLDCTTWLLFQKGELYSNLTCSMKTRKQIGRQIEESCCVDLYNMAPCTPSLRVIYQAPSVSVHTAVRLCPPKVGCHPDRCCPCAPTPIPPPPPSLFLSRFPHFRTLLSRFS